MKVVIIGNGPPPPPKTFQEIVSASDFIIAADGGAAHCLSHSVIPQMVVGDFDSLSTVHLEQLKAHSKVIHHPQEKDHSDLDLAYREAERVGATEIHIFSWADERIDYSWDTLVALRNSKIPLRLMGHQFEIRILNEFQPELSWIGDNQKISIGGLSAHLSLQTEGLKWDLHWIDKEAPQLSLSNRILERGQIRLLRGSAFVLIDRSLP